MTERKKLIEAASDEARPFIKGLCLLPLRPGALAGLMARDFDKRTRTLTIGRDKNGNPRQMTMPRSHFRVFCGAGERQAAGRTHLRPRRGRAMAQGRLETSYQRSGRAAGLPSRVSAYTLRHSVITDLIRARLPILTVAQLSGTSVAMIERHYGHLVRDDAEEALATLAI